MIEVRIAEDSELDRWNKLVESSSHGTIFHTKEWLKIVERHTKSKFFPLIGFKGQQSVGLFPIFYQRKGPLKMIFSPPPRCAIPYLGPILIDYKKLKQNKKESIFREFVNRVDAFIFDKIKPSYVLINLPPGLIDARPFKWAGYQVGPTYHYIIDLDGNTNQIWENFKQELRKNIKRTKDKINIKEGLREDLDFIYTSLIERYKEENKDFSVPRKYMIDIFNFYYPQNLRLFIAEYNEKCVGGILTTNYRDKVAIWLGAVSARLQGIYPNDLLQWEIIKWASESGFKYCEIIGANNPTISYFKSRYNFNLEICFTVKKSTLSGRIAEKTYSISQNL